MNSSIIKWVIVIVILVGFVAYAQVHFNNLSSVDEPISIPTVVDVEEEAIEEVSVELETEPIVEVPVESEPAQPRVTREPVSDPVPYQQVATTPEIDSKGYYVVRYTNDGFEPFISEVDVRDTIRFINNSDRPMWVTAHFHPFVEGQEELYPEFRQPKSVARGGEFIFTFIRSGTWGYKNMNHDAHMGAVVVVSD